MMVAAGSHFVRKNHEDDAQQTVNAGSPQGYSGTLIQPSWARSQYEGWSENAESRM